MSALERASLVARAASRLGTRLTRSVSAPRSTGIRLRSGSPSVQGLKAAAAARSTRLSVIASSTPAAIEHLADLLQHAVLAAAGRGGHGHAHILGNLLVAVDAGDFLNQVDLARQVAAPTGRHHRDRGRLGPDAAGRRRLDVAQRGENLPHALGRHVDAEDALQLRKSQHDGRPRPGPAAHVDHAGGQLAPGQVEDQLAAAAAGPIDPFRVHRPLEAVGRFAVQIEPPRRPADGNGIELGRFDEHGRG